MVKKWRLKIRTHPFETLVETITTRRACRLDVPCSLSESMKTELISDLRSVHCVGQILLVGEHKEKGITEFVLVQHALQLLTGFRHTLAIVGINHENDALGVLEIYSNVGRVVRGQE